MTCPKCDGKLKIRSTLLSDENEVYRQKKCLSCGYLFYTIEFEVENNKLLQKHLNDIRVTKYPSQDKKRKGE